MSIFMGFSTNERSTGRSAKVKVGNALLEFISVSMPNMTSATVNCLRARHVKRLAGRMSVRQPTISLLGAKSEGETPSNSEYNYICILT